jgi:predicted transglutaminase-like cysteine proteinase
LLRLHLGSPVRKVVRMKYPLYLPLIFIFLVDSNAVHAARSSYFDMNETRSENLKPFPKWSGMRERYDTQKEVSDDECDKAKYHPCVIKQWRNFVSQLSARPLKQKIKQINTWANKHPYIVDQLNWGMEDFWETPHEFMSVSGDCEDYAIAKYFSLRAAGVDSDDMRIIIVQDLNLGGIIHAILAVYDKGEMWILDNQIKQVMPARKIYHYRPIYGINENWWWAYSPKSS